MNKLVLALIAVFASSVSFAANTVKTSTPTAIVAPLETTTPVKAEVSKKAPSKSHKKVAKKSKKVAKAAPSASSAVPTTTVAK
jgi:hypothetical protein